MLRGQPLELCDSFLGAASQHNTLVHTIEQNAPLGLFARHGLIKAETRSPVKGKPG